METEIVDYQEAYDNLIQALERINMFGDILTSFGDEIDSLNKKTVVTMGLAVMDDTKQGMELASKLIGGLEKQ